jgi:DNA repair exonuclease SbcCD ATPase subunit
MTSQETDTPTLEGDIEAAVALEAKNTGSEADLLDRAGNAILGLVNRAAGTAAADVKAAREVAEKLADELRATRDQLQAAHDQINALNADVGRYQDRANRAEKWLQQISSEIEQKFLAADDRRPVLRGAPQQNEKNSPTGLSFLRRRRDH